MLIMHIIQVYTSGPSIESHSSIYKCSPHSILLSFKAMKILALTSQKQDSYILDWNLVRSYRSHCPLLVKITKSKN